MKTLRGKAVLQDDTLLMLGATFPYSKYLPDPVAGFVQIEADPTRARAPMSAAAPVVGDGKESPGPIPPAARASRPQSASPREPSVKDDVGLGS